MRFLLLLTLPSAVLLVVYSKPIVVLLLQHGSFDAHSTELTVETMTILSIAMMFRSHTYFSYRVLNSALQAWTQVTIGLLGVATSILLNMLWAEKLGLRGIALSTTLSAAQSAILASICVRRLLGTSGAQGRELMRIVAPIAVLGVAAFAGLTRPDTLQARSSALWAIAAGATVIPAALLAFALAWKLQIPEVGSLLALASRLTRRIPIGATRRDQFASAFAARSAFASHSFAFSEYLVIAITRYRAIARVFARLSGANVAGVCPQRSCIFV